MINWLDEVEKRQEDLIRDTQKLLQKKSVLEEETVEPGAPFGKGIQEAYQWFLDLGKKDGFTTVDVDGYGGHLEWGKGEELVGILCHLDVVPEGDGWTSPPYDAEIRDGNIYARGAIDDKGPTMAAYYALKIVKELGLPLNKRVRLIVGNDEESQWRCVDHYFEHEEMPTMGFAPDADFPIINAEKGICDLKYTTHKPLEHGVVEEFVSGQRLNMVPDKAVVKLTGVGIGDLEASFNQFITDKQLSGKLTEENGRVIIELNGTSAHGMEPDKGINSGLWLSNYLVNTIENLGVEERRFFSILNSYFLNDSRGRAIGIAYEDKDRGPLTINLGRMAFSKQTGGEMALNLRYPEGADFTFIYEKVEQLFLQVGYNGQIITHERPHAVSKDHPLIRTLSKVYEEQTGESAYCIAIGGGTYARSLKAGVAFGPMFPGQKDVAHQADEYISIDNLKKATAIYAQAIYELAKKR